MPVTVPASHAKKADPVIMAMQAKPRSVFVKPEMSPYPIVVMVAVAQ
jgi:hypothetical protein